MYEVLDLVRHSETEEALVLYRALYTSKYGQNALWVRPFKMFTENVTVNRQNIPRFEFLGTKGEA